VAVVVLVVVGLIVSSRAQPSRTFAAPGAAPLSVSTAEPQALQPLPYPDVARASLQQAVDRLDRGRALLVDVRSSLSYDKAHAAGALSIPEAEIEGRLDELPRDKELILYCT
jgi:hypothetical protein